MGVMGDGWTFNGPSRMSLGWIVDGHGLVRLRAVDIDTRCRRMRISAMDHPPTNSTHTNPHGDTMVTVPRSSEDDRYFVTFYALRDLYGTTLRHTAWRNQVHIQGCKDHDVPAPPRNLHAALSRGGHVPHCPCPFQNMPLSVTNRHSPTLYTIPWRFPPLSPGRQRRFRRDHQTCRQAQFRPVVDRDWHDRR